MEFIMLFSRNVLFALLTTFFMADTTFAASNPLDVKLPFRSAIIHYDVKNPEQGIETLYIRNYGKVTAKVTKTTGKIMFIKTSTDTAQITDPDWIVTVDMKKKTAMKITNPVKVMSEEYEKLSPEEQATVRDNIKKVGKNFGMRMDATIEKASADILGDQYEVVTAMGITTYNITETPIALKTKGSILGFKVEAEATKIEKNSQISDDPFRVPDGIEVTYDKEADNMNKALAQSMINYLKDPEAAQKTDRAMNDIEESAEKNEEEREEGAEQNETDPDNSEEPAEGKQGEANEMLNKGMDVLKSIFK